MQKYKVIKILMKPTTPGTCPLSSSVLSKLVSGWQEYLIVVLRVTLLQNNYNPVFNYTDNLRLL
jgi:hypothetical protein